MKLTSEFLKSKGYKLEYNRSLEVHFYQKDDVVVWDTLFGFKYGNSGKSLKTVDDLRNEIIEEFGEDEDI